MDLHVFEGKKFIIIVHMIRLRRCESCNEHMFWQQKLQCHHCLVLFHVCRNCVNKKHFICIKCRVDIMERNAQQLFYQIR